MIWPESCDSAEQRQKALQLPLWYGGPEQTEFNSVAVLESEAQGSAVNRVQHSAVQVDVISCWTHQTGHILRRASLVNLHNDGQSKAGTHPVENKIIQ